MNQESEVIGVRSQHPNSVFESNYVPLISFSNKEQKEVVEQYITSEAVDFLSNILKLNSDLVENQLAYPQIITPYDFKTKDISYFYKCLFYDLGEREINGKLKEKIKWGITFDEECAPYHPRIPKLPYRRYGTIDINGIPIFYYIHFTLQEILDVVKKIPVSKDSAYAIL